MIELSNVSKIYDTGSVTVRALDKVTLSIEEGEMVVILGPSGCGKTTVLNLIEALDTPSEGDVYLI
ncbi:MAG: ATP-binding cassette domain-containing protein [SAR202 cluster bacterium]|nr:MAG: ATP-binding cassette domain-containing protein [SAR202 cluster bacterium]MQG75064.1 ATP-binding cassette domain-containing protein [SAR202 cluster bacterium]